MYPFSFILGIFAGRALNLLIDGLLRDRSLVAAQEHEPAGKIAWWQLLPLAGPLLSRRRGQSSGAATWRRALAVELFCGLAFMLAYLKYGFSPQWGVILFYLSFFLVITVIDLKENLILNKLVYPALPLALLLTTFFPLGLAADKAPLDSFLWALLGGAVAFIILLIPALIWEGGMGWGDVKLAGLIGLATGFPGNVVALGLAIIGGGLLAIVLILLGRRKRRDVIPFGPFLCVGALAALVWGEAIVRWYLGFMP